jgi:hypothetical protein
MKHAAGRTPDQTGEAATGDMASDSLFKEVLVRVGDEADRVLLLAHIGLEISIRNLSRALDVSADEVAARIAGTVETLREDQELAAKLQDIRRAGRNENYQALTFALGLQDWFCSECGQFMVPSEVGAMRKTCSGRCRTRLYRAGGVGWKDEHHAQRAKSPQRVRDGLSSFAPPSGEFLRALIAPMSVDLRPKYIQVSAPRTFWWQPDTRLRDRAIVLLGFAGPVVLTPADIVDLDVNDIVRTSQGMELRLRARDPRPTQYRTIPTRSEPDVCPVVALAAWRSRLARAGQASGPLFVRMDEFGRLPSEPSRLHARSAAKIFTNVGVHAIKGMDFPRAAPSSPLPAFLDQIREQPSSR